MSRRGEALIKLLFTGIIVAVTVFVVVAVTALGLEVLTKPYVLAPITSALGSSGAYLEVLSTKRNARVLRCIGRMIMTTGLVIFVVLIAKLLGII